MLTMGLPSLLLLLLMFAGAAQAATCVGSAGGLQACVATLTIPLRTEAVSGGVYPGRRRWAQGLVPEAW